MNTRKIKLIKSSQSASYLLKGRKIAVIGYGSQGRAQALNLRDSGFKPLIGLKSGSKSRRRAHNDGLSVTTPSKAAKNADIIAVLIPDHKHKELFEGDLQTAIRPEHVFIFAHALSVHFGLVKQPHDVDFLLVAPHGPGIRVREKYLAGEGVTAFIGKTDKSSQAGLKLAASYASAIGCGRAGLIETSFRDEAVGDIFGEQAVLCGGLSGLLKAGFETLVKAGLPPGNAYLECVYQLDLIVDLIKKYGIGGMYDRISVTAAYGALKAEPQIINVQSQRAMAEMLDNIKSGEFVDCLMAEYEKKFTHIKAAQKKNHESLLDEMARYFAFKFPD